MKKVSCRAMLLLLASLFIGTAHAATDDQTMSPPEWRYCSTDSDCKIFLYGCDKWAASNLGHFDETRNLMFIRGGNPATLKCAVPQQPVIYTGECVNKQCTAVPSH